MSDRSFTLEDLNRLAQWDTPTICNAVEMLAPERRTMGFTTQPVVPLYPKMPPIVGLARTGTIRAREIPRTKLTPRADWYSYVAASDLPTIVIVQDVDTHPGFGAYWGEVHTAIHRRLGALGCVTNGSFRDLAMCDPAFQILGGCVGTSNAYVHLVDFGNPVDVLGMHVCHDDVIHADLHGAVIVPSDCVRAVPDAVDLLLRREKFVLDLVRGPDFTLERLQDALAQAGEIR